MNRGLRDACALLRWQRYISVQHHLTMELRTKYRPLRETNAALPVSNLSCVFWAEGVQSLPEHFANLSFYPDMRKSISRTFTEPALFI